MPFCPQLPEITTYQDFHSDFQAFYGYLYHEIFLVELYQRRFCFREKPVRLKTYPLVDDMEQAFFHLTHKDFRHENPENREPDFRRAERLGWIRPAIETNHQEMCKEDCFLYYETKWKSKIRTNLLCPEEYYHIILEERTNYYLLITAYYIDYDNRLTKELRKYERFEETQRPV